MKVLCECSSPNCFLTVELPTVEAERRGRLVLIVDGCKRGPEPTDELVGDRGGYSLYRDCAVEAPREIAS